MMKILIICPLGIGNTLLAEPMVRLLKSHMPDAELFLVSGAPGSREILMRSVAFSGTWRIPIREIQTRTIGFSDMLRFLKILYRLRKLKPDVSITTVPANRAIWNWMAFFIGAKLRITHSYPNNRLIACSFLQNCRIPIQHIHDIQQNLRLLEGLKIPIPQNKESMRLILTDQETASALSYLRKNNLYDSSVKRIAFHIGCDPDAPRRWHVERYARLIEKLSANENLRFLIIAGPAETEISQSLANQLLHLTHPPVVVKPESIFHAGAVLKFCHLLISNDSGIMHTGTAVGIPVLAIFGPSDNTRMAPYQDQKNVISADVPCRPCTTSLKNIGERFSCPHPAMHCMENITADMVYERVMKQNRTTRNRIF